MFGAFLFGACLPRDDRLLDSLAERIEPLSIVVLMPLFFAKLGAKWMLALGMLSWVVRYALFAPIYWGLMSIGAWMGFYQLFTKPFYWEKTEHGLDAGDH